MGGNAIVFAPHPRTKKTNTLIVNKMREALKKFGAPEDLIIGIENPTMDASSELMSSATLLLQQAVQVWLNLHTHQELLPTV